MCPSSSLLANSTATLPALSLEGLCTRESRHDLSAGRDNDNRACPDSINLSAEQGANVPARTVRIPI
jgi:hypothetical protein